MSSPPWQWQAPPAFRPPALRACTPTIGQGSGSGCAQRGRRRWRCFRAIRPPTHRRAFVCAHAALRRGLRLVCASRHFRMRRRRLSLPVDRTTRTGERGHTRKGARSDARSAYGAVLGRQRSAEPSTARSDARRRWLCPRSLTERSSSTDPVFAGPRLRRPSSSPPPSSRKC